MLKCDFHMHTSEDPKHKDKIEYSAYELIDFASEKKFDVLAITLHDKVLFNPKLQCYAKRKRILLIPGAEMRIDYQDFLVLMKKPILDVEKVKTYGELEIFKKKYKKDILIIIPHLFYPNHPKNKRSYGVADAFEYSHFYLTWFNPNKKAVELAKKTGKAIVGTSDAHALWQIDHTYSVIDCKKNIDSIFSAIKRGDVSVITRPFFTRTFFYNIFSWSIGILKEK